MIFFLKGLRPQLYIVIVKSLHSSHLKLETRLVEHVWRKSEKSGSGKRVDKMFAIATEPSVFFVFVSYGLYISVVPQLTVFKVCHSFYNETICTDLSTGNYKSEEKRVYDEATKWNTICFASIMVLSVLTSMVLGVLSDLMSKRKVLLIPPIILLVQSIILIFSAKYTASSMVILALAASLTGLYADVQGFLMMAYAYMADVTEANDTRTLRMAILGGLTFFSTGLSSFVAGILLKSYGFIVPLSLTLVASVMNLIFVTFILPETKSRAMISLPTRQCSEDTNSRENTGSSGEKDENLLISQAGKEKSSTFNAHLKASCWSMVEFFKKHLFSCKNKHVCFLLLSIFFTSSALTGEGVIIVLFLKHRPLALSPDRIGEFLLTLQCITGIGVIILTVVSAKFFKPSDRSVIIVGQISIMATYTAVGLSKEWHPLLSMTPLAIGLSLPLSGIRSLLTKWLEPEEHASALSCVAFLNNLSAVAITFGCNELFRQTAEIFPGLAVVLLSIACFVGLVLAIAAFYSNPADVVKTGYIHV